MKRAGVLLLYAVCFSLIFYAGYAYWYYLRAMMQQTLERMPFFIFSVTFPFFLGMMASIPYVIKEKRRFGRWRYDWLKLLIFGLPAFYVSSFYVLAMYTAQYEKLNLVLFPAVFDLFMQPSVSGIASFILGCVVVQCFYKAELQMTVNQ
ncbi:hypothetical protein [Aneurinibacillus sp. REN35]|uniref:hypothetical protein n=1 Tax=Aneurinibacillus sp. REN35 TaxID=3237286 RepID=UPI003527D446